MKAKKVAASSATVRDDGGFCPSLVLNPAAVARKPCGYIEQSPERACLSADTMRIGVVFFQAVTRERLHNCSISSKISRCLPVRLACPICGDFSSLAGLHCPLFKHGQFGRKSILIGRCVILWVLSWNWVS